MDEIISLIYRHLPKLIPIVLGASIGFVTNVVAIRMLFRPLREYRVFGLRVPLTPGIIPRQRKQLAKSIGNMVSGKLLNTEAILVHIRSESFQRSLTEGMEQMRLPSGKSADSVQAFHPLSQATGTLVRSMVTRDGLEDILRSAGASIGKLPLSNLLPKSLMQGVVQRTIDYHVEMGLGPKLIETISRLTAVFVEENRNLQGILTPEVRQAFTRVLESTYEPGVAFFLTWLRRPEIRHELSIRGKHILWDILRKLTSVQRFLLSAGQYDKTLEERMPEIISDLLKTLEGSLENPENKDRLIGAFSELLEQLAGTPVQELESRLGTDLVLLVRRSGEALLGVLAQERVGLRLEIVLHRFVERHRNVHGESIIRLVTGAGSRALAEKLAGTWEAWVRVPGNVEGVVDRFFIGSEKDITGSISGLLERVLPEVVQRLDVQALVENRINSLDVLEVERLLLSIMARHFKWINLFGAILGAIIGALQLLPAVPWG